MQKTVHTTNSGYNHLATQAIKFNCKKYNMDYETLMQHISDTLKSHQVLNRLEKKHIIKFETVDTHCYILIKSNYTYKKQPITDVVASIVNSMFFGMCLDNVADTINNPQIAGWCRYNKFTFVSPSMFIPARQYQRTHTRQQIKALYK